MRSKTMEKGELVSEEDKFNIKQYFEAVHNESLTDVTLRRYQGALILDFKFEFESSYGTMVLANIIIKDLPSEVHIQNFVYSKNSVIRSKVHKLSHIILNEVLIKWFPAIYLSTIFKTKISQD